MRPTTGIQPTSLLDIGSGRGTFLWPLLDTLPTLPVIAIDAADDSNADDSNADDSNADDRLCE